MKPTRFANGPLLLAIFAAILTIGLVSWDYKQSPSGVEKSSHDTVPKKSADREKKVRDLDDVLEELEEAEADFDMNKIRIELTEALKDLDVDVKLKIENALKDVDMEKIKLDVERSLASVDMEKIQKELTDAMKDFDAAKIQKEVQAALASVDMKKIQAELEKVKNMDLDKMQKELNAAKLELEKIGPELEKNLSNAKVELEKAKTEIREYKTFVDGLDKDGVINKKEEYRIRHEDGVLEINGKKVSDAVYNKYRSFLEKHKEFTIKKTADDFDIDMD